MAGFFGGGFNNRRNAEGGFQSSFADKLGGLGSILLDLDQGGNRFGQFQNRMGGLRSDFRAQQAKAAADEESKRRFEATSKLGQDRLAAVIEQNRLSNEFRTGQAETRADQFGQTFGAAQGQRDIVNARAQAAADATASQRGVSNQLGQDRLELAQQIATQKAAAGDTGGNFGNLIKLTDEQGNLVLAQPSKSGTPNIIDFGEGLTPLGVFEGAELKARGTKTGTETAKRIFGQTKAGNALQSARVKADRIKEDISTAIKQSTGGTTGPLQGRFAISKKAANFDATIKSIQARIGFNELQEMRNNSPTGGALGQVSEREIDFLQALMGSISRLQDETQLDANLERISGDIEASFKRMEDAYIQDFESGKFGIGAAQPTTPPQSQPLDFSTMTEEELQRIAGGG